MSEFRNRRDRLSPSDLALLAELADGAAPTGARRARAEALLADEACGAEVAEHQRLVAALREHAPSAPSLDWRALEASIQRACEVERQQPRSWLWRLRAWRWPALALGVASAAAAVLVLRRAEPAPATRPLVAEASARPSEPAPSRAHAALGAEPDGPGGIDVIDAWAALPDEAGWLDDERDDASEAALGWERDDGAMPDPPELPRAAAITLGLSTDPELTGDEEPEPGADAAETGEPWLEELHQLDGESLRRLDAWLDATKQKG